MNKFEKIYKTVYSNKKTTTARKDIVIVYNYSNV